MIEDFKNFLGKGLKFPVEVNPQTHSFASSTGEDKIRESVLIILGTVLGERVMRPDFGSAIQNQVFAPIHAATISTLSFNVQEALIAWEPRIEVQNVRVSDEKSKEGVLLISVDYKVRSTNNRFNLVYPFYVKGFSG
jgi:phage baseplate assembly protein W